MHYKKEMNSLLNSYLIALIPLLIFGLYKNGLYLYINDLLNLKNIFIPLYFYLISIIVALIVSIILKENKKVNILISLILASSISLNTNMLIYPILLFVLLFISNVLNKKINIYFNSLSLIRLFLILALLFNSYSYLNIGEKINIFNYNLLDKFIGFQIGGIASSSVLLVLLALIILSFNKFYKKNIAIFASLTYFIFNLIFNYMFFKSLVWDIKGTIYFSFVFIASDIYVSPTSNMGMIIYGVLIGFLTSILGLFGGLEAGFISIFLSSLLIPLINKVTNRKYLKS